MKSTVIEHNVDDIIAKLMNIPRFIFIFKIGSSNK